MPEASADDPRLAFSAHLRDPDGIAAPAHIEARRMAIYRELVQNNLIDLLGGNFPVLRALHDDAQWSELVRAFLRDHRCSTPLFTEIACEFIRFLEARAPSGIDPPFFVELAQYEWSELALAIDEADIDSAPHDRSGDPVTGIPVLSPLARLLAWRYPVQHIGPAFRPHDPPAQPTLIVLVRTREGDVGFLEVDPLSAMLFQTLSRNTDACGADCVDAVLASLGRSEPGLRASGLYMLHEFHRREIVLGTR
ncbi:putative DNA-binding domain-containing protein [Dokdonella sp.]|uniref:HvfC family RiPP maturation protein n=1 Tax=Dokdonella sp. TaxID=2291710 RepID=UPI0025C5E82C|nr:putative DNA-binding domain-containing protein [Dokdonella sp.]MBX3693481.1 putative DNA-binding domain-containing protein [Dokdonella sp.]MCW5567640.1 putative DNA-binding domain-containing protein [Dokdonella sp.]